MDLSCVPDCWAPSLAKCCDIDLVGGPFRIGRLWSNVPKPGKLAMDKETAPAPAPTARRAVAREQDTARVAGVRYGHLAA